MGRSSLSPFATSSRRRKFASATWTSTSWRATERPACNGANKPWASPASARCVVIRAEKMVLDPLAPSVTAAICARRGRLQKITRRVKAAVRRLGKEPNKTPTGTTS
ncbi:unnamed protein product [Amoebophrya sp. A120]|nr:unnamed protein product [Amoebophrya sp. A120]|eukprot:GSA120T00001211001.1